MSSHLDELAQRAAAGDQGALQSLLVAHLPSIEAFVRLRAYGVVAAKESCADLVQSACLQALRNLDKLEFRGDAEFRNWLFGNVVHKIAHRARHHRAAKRDVAREVEVDHAAADSLLGCYASICSPSRHAEGREALAAFEVAFDELPEDYQQAVALNRVAGLSYDEIAEQMGRSAEAVRLLVYRGLAKLLARLDD